jgi:uncharacterized protein YjiS (DUF1127 family)
MSGVNAIRFIDGRRGTILTGKEVPTMASLSLIPAPALRRWLPQDWQNLPRRLATQVMAMWRAAATRRYLAEMDARMLQDIGLSRAEAQQEASRWPWDCGSGRAPR